jgi:hypothetical protein
MMQRPLRQDEIVHSIRFVVPGTVTVHDAASPTRPVVRQGSIEVTIHIRETGQQIAAKVLSVTP